MNGGGMDLFFLPLGSIGPAGSGLKIGSSFIPLLSAVNTGTEVFGGLLTGIAGVLRKEILGFWNSKSRGI